MMTLKDDVNFTRNELVEYLEANKIQTRNLFAGNMIKQPAFKDVKYRVVGDLKNTDYIMKNTLFIGVYPGITDEMIRYILSVFANFFNNIK